MVLKTRCLKFYYKPGVYWDFVIFYNRHLLHSPYWAAVYLNLICSYKIHLKNVLGSRIYGHGS